MRLLFVDDHPVVSSGLAARYGSLAGFVVVGTAATFHEAIARAADADVAVVDVQLEVVLTPRQVAALAERTRVVLFSARSGDPLVQQLLAAGASAVLDKSAPFTALDALLRDVHAGRVPTTTTTASTTTSTAATALATAMTTAMQRLSAREHDVYLRLARGEAPKEIAAGLGIARSTVYCHVERVRQKLGLTTVAEIVAHALTGR